jgi:hypothetical protein
MYMRQTSEKGETGGWEELLRVLAPPRWLNHKEMETYVSFTNTLLELDQSSPQTFYNPEEVCEWADILYVGHANSKLNWSMHLAFLTVYRNRLLQSYGIKYGGIEDFLGRISLPRPMYMPTLIDVIYAKVALSHKVRPSSTLI